MTQKIQHPAVKKLKVALVGGNQDGLLTLASLTQDPSTEVVILIDQDQKALAFRLHEYGFTFDKIFTFTLSSDINELKTIGDLDLIVDALDDPTAHQALYRLNHPHARIMTSQCARILWEIKSIPFRETLSDGFDLNEAGSDLTRRQAISLEKSAKALPSLTGSLPPDEIHHFILDTLLYTLEGNWGALYLEGDAEQEVVCVASRVLSNPDGDKTPEIHIKEGLTGFIGAWARKKKEPLLLSPPYPELWMESFMEVSKLRQAIIMPLFDQKRFMGFLGVGKLSEEPLWGEGEVAFVQKWVLQEGFTNFFLPALEKQTPLDPLHRILRNIMDRPKSLQEKLEEGTREIGTFLNASSAFLFVKDPESGDLVLQSQTGLSFKMNGIYRMKPDEGIAGAALLRETPVYLKEEEGHGDHGYPIGILFYPLMVQSHPVGLLILEFQSLTRDFFFWQKDFKETAEILAISIASDVERKYMAQKVLKLTVVNEEGLELVSITDRDKVLMIASASTAMILEAEGVILRVKEKESPRLLVGYTYGLHNDPMDKLLIQMDGILAAQVAESRQPLMSSAIKDIVFLKEKVPPKFPYHSVLTIPLLEQDELVGTLSVYNKVIYNSFAASSFNETDRELIEKYGHFVSKALVKAKEFQNREKLITIDDLTGLKNERYFFLRLPEELKRAERYKRKLALLFLDVDKTKKEFFRLPVVIYDQLIQKMGQVIRENFRNVDITVRIKGSRFAVLLPDTGSRLKDTVSRLYQSLSAVRVINQNQEVLPLHLLSGFSTYPEDGLTLEELVKKASRMVPQGVD